MEKKTFKKKQKVYWIKGEYIGSERADCWPWDRKTRYDMYHIVVRTYAGISKCGDLVVTNKGGEYESPQKEDVFGDLDSAIKELNKRNQDIYDITYKHIGGCLRKWEDIVDNLDEKLDKRLNEQVQEELNDLDFCNIGEIRRELDVVKSNIKILKFSGVLLAIALFQIGLYFLLSGFGLV